MYRYCTYINSIFKGTVGSLMIHPFASLKRIVYSPSRFNKTAYFTLVFRTAVIAHIPNTFQVPAGCRDQNCLYVPGTPVFVQIYNTF